VARGVTRRQKARRDRRVVRPPGGQRRAELVLHGRARKLRAIPQVLFEVVDQLHRFLRHLEAEPGVDLRVRPREVPEIPRRSVRRFEHQGVVVLDGFGHLDHLAVRRTELLERDVRVEGGVPQVGFVLEDREGAGAVDHYLGVVGDHVAVFLPAHAGDGAIVVLEHVLNDRVVVEPRTRLLGTGDQTPAVLQPVDHREFPGDGNL